MINKIKSHVSYVIALTAVVLFQSCSSVSMTKPLPAHTPKDNAKKLEGVWMLDKTVVYMKHTKNGIYQLAGIDWKDEKFTLEKAEFVISKTADNHFLSIRIFDDGKWSDYTFARYKFHDVNTLVVWPPHVDEYKILVTNKKLSGKVAENEVTLTDSPEKILKILDEDKNSKLFEYKNPIILKRISNAEIE